MSSAKHIILLSTLGVVLVACQGRAPREQSGQGMPTSIRDQRPEMRAYFTKLEEWKRNSAVSTRSRFSLTSIPRLLWRVSRG